MQGLTIQKPFHTTSYNITTDSKRLYDWLEVVYGEFSTNVLQATHNIQVEVCAEHSKINIDGISSIVNDPILYLNNYIYNNSTIAPGYFIFHASAVQKDDKAFVFLSPTSRGKSTLTCYLVNNSYQFIADDIVVFDILRMQIQKVNNNIHLRPQGYKVIREFVSPERIKHFSYYSFDRYIYRPLVSDTQNNIKSIEFIYTKFSLDNRVTILDIHDRNTILYKSAIYPYNINSNVFLFISQMQNKFKKMIEYNSFDYLISNL